MKTKQIKPSTEESVCFKKLKSVYQSFIDQMCEMFPQAIRYVSSLPVKQKCLLHLKQIVKKPLDIMLHNGSAWLMMELDEIAETSGGGK